MKFDKREHNSTQTNADQREDCRINQYGRMLVFDLINEPQLESKGTTVKVNNGSLHAGHFIRFLWKAVGRNVAFPG